MARIGRPDILWSVNNLARARKWTKSCYKRLARLISYIHHTREYRQYCYVRNTAQQCRLGLFQDSDFAGDLEDSKSTSGGVLCIFGSVPISWMCKKQTSVSHSSTEVEIISLDAGLRMDGIPALTLWDLVKVFRSEPNKTDVPKRELRGNPSAIVKPNMHNPIPVKHTNVIPTNIDDIPSTKGNFTRDEWNNLLRLFNISHFSSTCCTKNFSLISCSTMTKRIENQAEEERVVSKSRPAVMNISSFIATSSSAASSPIASKIPRMPIASVKLDSRMSVDPSLFDAASTSQVRLKDAYLGGLMEKQRGNPSHQDEENSEDSDNLEAGTWYYKKKPVAQNKKDSEKPLAHGASSSVDRESQ